jgi:gentisate 1,2-dioxygenase
MLKRQQQRRPRSEVCLEGSGHAEINGAVHTFGPNDVFVVPPWNELRIHATADMHLFSFSDRPVHQALGALARSAGVR